MSEPELILPPRLPGGRPTKFTPANIRRMLKCAKRGLPLTLVAQAAGISFQTLLNYRKANPRFEDALQRSIAKGTDERLKKIEEASATDWRAASWLLEHTMPQYFAKSRLEISGTDGQPLAAGVQLYLPEKRNPVVAVGDVDTLALSERNANGNE
ncbi:MAG TPA: hypothetical protein VG167_15660 [Verrucomicrobiae bacterium]|nr:hypothetical protein [Verrucomicrobiae bacterium]